MLYVLIYLGIAVFSIFPLVWLYRSYQRTGILDFLLFAVLFFSVVIHSLTWANVVSDYPMLELEVISTLSYDFIWLLLFIHSYRVKWEKTPPLLWYSTIASYIVIQIIYIVVFILNYPYYDMSNFPNQLSYSLSQMYRLIALLVAIFIYSTVKHIIVDKRVKQARNFWIIAALLFMIPPIWALLSTWNIWILNPFISTITNMSNLLAIIFVTFIVVKYPESVLITKVQVIRVLDLYKTVRSSSSAEDLKEFGLPSLVSYMKNIPPEVLTLT